MCYTSDTPVAVEYMSPSVTPWRWPRSEKMMSRNPAIRMFEFDTATYAMTDVKQYYLVLEEANNKG